jgi:L-alanine-DL-glutamate epimerase-like enolase superfamily enzyme
MDTMEIAAMADAFPVTVSVHNNNTMTIGLAAAIPNVTLVGYFPRFVKGSNTFSTFAAELDDDGCIPLSHEPGIGATVDEAIVVAS